MNFFRSEEHLSKWEGFNEKKKGGIIALRDLMQLFSGPYFTKRREPDYFSHLETLLVRAKGQARATDHVVMKCVEVSEATPDDCVAFGPRAGRSRTRSSEERPDHGGKAGTFGRAFAARLLNNRIAGRVCVYSRGEHRQAEMRRDFGDDERVRFFIGDVRDRDRLRRAMDGGELVVHAAALKRVEVGEYNPGEMVKTNVDGAVNVVEAAFDATVPKVVALSRIKPPFICLLKCSR